MNVAAKLEEHVENRKRNNAEPPQSVTVQWLSKAFAMNHQTVRDKLRNCPVMASRRAPSGEQKMYDLKVAAAYLVTPKLPSSAYLAALKKGDLPLGLQDQLWAALLKRQQYEEKAGDLWRTDKIREVLRETFQAIKFATQLWVDTVEKQKGLDKSQRDLLVLLSDELLKEIGEALVERVAKSSTGSQLDELPGLLGEATEVREEDQEDEEADELI